MQSGRVSVLTYQESCHIQHTEERQHIFSLSCIPTLNETEITQKKIAFLTTTVRHDDDEHIT